MGNPDKRRLNEDERQPAPAIPDCPRRAWIGCVEWNRLVAQLASLRIRLSESLPQECDLSKGSILKHKQASERALRLATETTRVPVKKVRH